jgi:hypothetical protein
VCSNTGAKSTNSNRFLVKSPQTFACCAPSCSLTHLPYAILYFWGVPLSEINTRSRNSSDKLECFMRCGLMYRGIVVDK